MEAAKQYINFRREFKAVNNFASAFNEPTSNNAQRVHDCAVEQDLWQGMRIVHRTEATFKVERIYPLEAYAVSEI